MATRWVFSRHLRRVAGTNREGGDRCGLGWARFHHRGARHDLRGHELCSGLVEATVHRSGDRVAGFLCAFSFALSGIALARTPGLLAPAAILVALVAVQMTEAHRTLAAVAVAVSGLAFFFGMVIAIATDSPLF